MSTFPRPVLDAFPEHRERLSELIDSDEGFAELCDHFDEVVAAHSRAATSDQASQHSHASEYHSLRLELETEILQMVDCRARHLPSPDVRTYPDALKPRYSVPDCDT